MLVNLATAIHPNQKNDTRYPQRFVKDQQAKYRIKYNFILEPASDAQQRLVMGRKE